MDKRILGLGAALLIAGVLALAATIYQERVAPPDLEDYHMGVPSGGKYEWRSRSVEATLFGVLSVASGAGCLCVAVRKRLSVG